MKLMNFPVLSDERDRAVVKMPGRHFPGVVIQGETLMTWCRVAARIQEIAAEAGSPELQLEVTSLLDQLSVRLSCYQEVLEKHGLKVPQ